jgi:AcrR family transcriptional regulator/DNA-binding MarR family transcriptional regulator
MPRKAPPLTAGARNNGGGAGQIAQIQRARILGAATALAAERGIGEVNASRILARAGVSRRTFYELFDGAEECFLAAAEDALALAGARVRAAYDPAEPWRVRVRAGLLALLRFFDEEPQKARLLVIESLGAGPEAMRRRELWLEPLRAAVDAGRAESGRAAQLPALTAQGVVGGAVSVIHTRMLQADPTPLAALTSPLMSMIALPYLGAAAARRELAAAAPASLPARAHTPLVADRLALLPMRLTRRTILVLRAIAAEPGASNRRVGRLAEVEDQGQMSKLLWRLERLGLATNSGGTAANGMANAWTLTPEGVELERATHGSEAAPH